MYWMYRVEIDGTLDLLLLLLLLRGVSQSFVFHAG